MSKIYKNQTSCAPGVVYKSCRQIRSEHLRIRDQTNDKSTERGVYFMKLIMNITISGATGLLWSALTSKLIELWHHITVVSRSTSKPIQIFWESVSVTTWDKLNPESMDWCEVCIHLAGTSIMTLPWNQKNKDRIRNSRIETTRKIITALPDSCHTFMCASAIWYYPSDSDRIFDTSYTNSDPQTFLEKLCVQRETEAYKAKKKSRRVVAIRTWLVTWHGTFEDKLIKSTKILGWIVLWSGKQYMSLISKKDRVDNIIYCINHDNISGPINNVSQSMTYRQYVTQLAKKYRRPTRIHVPNMIIKIILWEASQLFLWSQRVKSFFHQ